MMLPATGLKTTEQKTAASASRMPTAAPASGNPTSFEVASVLPPSRTRKAAGSGKIDQHLPGAECAAQIFFRFHHDL